MDTILSNAVQSIQIGMEDSKSPDPRRVLSAIRNVQAGILLLCKEKLRLLSPLGSDEVLVRERIAPHLNAAGELTFRGTGPKTVDQHQIKERFKTLGVKVNWGPLDKLTGYRNNLEHYAFSGARSELTEALGQAAVIIQELVEDVLALDPASLLGADCWEALLESEALYELALTKCRYTIAAIRWISPAMGQAVEDIECSVCGSQLIEQADVTNTDQRRATFRCIVCHMECSAEEIVPFALSKHLFADAYLAMTDGGEWPLGDCPSCGVAGAIPLGEGERICALCGDGFPEASCAVCHAALSVDEISENGSLCAYHLHQALKDD
ncbi:hypothetical protein [Phenylobacterium koreense]|uniref:Uncharacterized protein n=1 Tax=Phenylobacterium koreense TaxID=266125 RepID=A0ABV2EMB0_9CAUL